MNACGAIDPANCNNVFNDDRRGLLTGMKAW
jgi:hypothetical protein